MSRVQPRAPGLLTHWPRVATQIRASRRVVLFLDFDGTLVNIAPLPHQVSVKPSARRILKRLARHPRVTVVVISGRRRHELVRFIGLRGVRYHGLYGWERTGRCPLPRSTRRALRNAERKLAARLCAIPGVWIEDKRFSLSVHLLGAAPRRQQKARRDLRALLRPFHGSLRVIENLRDVEIVPRCIPGKGSAVAAFLAQLAPGGILPIYFGDDLSDESAFQAIGDGVSVRVGTLRRPTRARYSLRDPAAVASALAKLEAALI